MSGLELPRRADSSQVRSRPLRTAHLVPPQVAHGVALTLLGASDVVMCAKPGSSWAVHTPGPGPRPGRTTEWAFSQAYLSVSKLEPLRSSLLPAVLCCTSWLCELAYIYCIRLAAGSCSKQSIQASQSRRILTILICSPEQRCS